MENEIGLKCSMNGEVKKYVENYMKTHEQKRPLVRSGRY
jgi:hypothetical protein